MTTIAQLLPAGRPVPTAVVAPAARVSARSATVFAALLTRQSGKTGHMQPATTEVLTSEGVPGRSGAIEHHEEDERAQDLGPLERRRSPLVPSRAHDGASGTSAAGEMPIASEARGAGMPARTSWVSIAGLLPALVRKIAWSGDARRGTVRMEIGAGPLAGSVVIIHADEGEVRVHVSAPTGLDADAWRDRITQGITARGLFLASVEVEIAPSILAPMRVEG